MLQAYDRSLKIVLERRFATLVVSGLIFVATIFLFVIIPKGFLPSEDIGQIFGFTEAVQGISFDSMKEHQLKVAAIVRQDPNVGSV
jgi:HAE1 family hydrophobic/amphiphilic exporter-1